MKNKRLRRGIILFISWYYESVFKFWENNEMEGTKINSRN